MEKPPQKSSKPKQEKSESDGLSKKERRALKLQARQDGTPQPITQTEKTAVPAASAPALSEKELRKLEWEKRLAEQKKQSAPGDNATSKTELKQKRREQQEAQRQAKAAEKKPPPSITAPKTNLAKKITSPIKIAVKKVNKKGNDPKRLQIVRHLYADDLKPHGNNIVHKNVHPAFVKLGVQYATKKVLGSNARCLALLYVIRRLIHDLEAPRDQEFCRVLEHVLNDSVEFLQESRPFAVSMSNALRYFKIKLQDAKKMADTVTQKDFLLLALKTYIQDEIDKAGEAISLKVNEKIRDGDVILTFGCSSLVKTILLEAHKAGKSFEVVVVDGRPLLEGRQMLQRLVQAGIRCSYVLINAISYVMSHVTKILLGAHALLSNGYVMSRIGTAQVALVAQAYNKPVLVCCETYKFSERVQTDSFVYNELGGGEMMETIDTMEEASPLINVRNDSHLKVLNLLYDVTPADFITAVVTEYAILPCSSAPVVLRVKPTDFSDK